MDTIAPSCLPCIHLDLDASEAPIDSPAEQKGRFRSGLERTAEHLGQVSQLEEVILAAQIVSDLGRRPR